MASARDRTINPRTMIATPALMTFFPSGVMPSTAAEAFPASNDWRFCDLFFLAMTMRDILTHFPGNGRTTQKNSRAKNLFHGPRKKTSPHSRFQGAGGLRGKSRGNESP